MELPSTLASYPEVPGFKESGTSAEAAAGMVKRAERLRDACKAKLVDLGPLTADECAAALGESVLSVRPRFSQLRATGEVEDSKLRRPNASGRRAVVWRLTLQLKQSEMEL